MRKVILLSAVAILFSVSFARVAAQVPKLTASIDSTVIEMGSRAKITLDVSDPSKIGHFVNLPQPGTETEQLDFIEITADTFPSGYKYEILIQAFIPGDITLDPFKFAYNGDTVESNYLSLKVLPVELDSLETINPLESVVNVPRIWYDYIPDYVWWIILALALVAIGVALYMIYRKHGTLIIHRTKPVDPYETAMSELNRLRQQRLAETGREKEYYTALVDILRKYLEQRFAINAMEMTTTQILSTLRSNPETKDNQPRIKQILEIADFVKFANVRPLPDDNIKTFNNVVSFVEDTKPVPVEEENSENEKSPKN